MSLKNSTAKKASSLTKTVNASPTISIQLTDASYSVMSEAVAKNNHFQAESQKAQKDLSNNLIMAIEGAGLNANDFAGVNLNNDTKELILTKK